MTYADRTWTAPDGLALYARDYGPGPGPARAPVIAIHGLTRNSADFDAIAPLIAQSGRRVLAVDVRGRGRSDRAPDPMTYQPPNYAREHNAIALPHYDDADWDAFARRVFRERADGGLELDYDPDIAVPIRAAGAKALVPNLWPYFRRLARKRPTLLIRGETSDLLGADIAERMRKAAPTMAFAEVPDVGHAPMLDEPAAKAAIFAFLAERD